MNLAASPAALARSGDPPKENPSSAPKRIRALIVDDQLIEREILRRMLRNEPDVEIIGTCSNGREAVETINRSRPDLVFLDVQMPELDGFGVVSRIDPSRVPAIIFVTANEEFARKAFDVHALDYLIKPCTRERFRIALQRAREEVRRKRANHVREQLSALLNDLPTSSPLPDRLAAPAGDRILVIAFSEIDWMEAVDNGTRVSLGKECHLLRDTLAVLESRLPAEQFLRINRSTIVNAERIKELQPLAEGEYTVVLRTGRRLTLTSGYRDRLQRLGL